MSLSTRRQSHKLSDPHFDEAFALEEELRKARERRRQHALDAMSSEWGSHSPSASAGASPLKGGPHLSPLANRRTASGLLLNAAAVASGGGGSSHHSGARKNAASEMLRKLQSEMDELDPNAAKERSKAAAARLLAPIPNAPRPQTDGSSPQKGGGGKKSLLPLAGARSASAGPGRVITDLPAGQKGQLSAQNRLPPLVNFAVPDGNVESIHTNFPPASSDVLVRTPFGAAIPAVLHTAVDIAAEKQRNDNEIFRAEIGTDPQLLKRHGAGANRPATGSRLAPIAPLLATEEGQARLTKALGHVKLREHASTLIQQCARAAIAHRAIRSQAAARVQRWYRRLRRALHRRYAIIRLLQMRQESQVALARNYCIAWEANVRRRSENEAMIRSLVLDEIVYGKLLSRRVKAVELYAAENLPLYVHSVMSRWLQSAHAARTERKLAAMIERNERLYKRRAWARLVDACIGRNRANPMADHALVRHSRVYAMRKQSERRHALLRFRAWLALYVERVRGKTMRVNMQIALKAVLAARREREVSRVFAVAMIKAAYAHDPRSVSDTAVGAKKSWRQTFDTLKKYVEVNKKRREM